MNQRKATHESCPEVDGVTYRPGVYKAPMVRMSERTDEGKKFPCECTGLNEYHAEMYEYEKS